MARLFPFRSEPSTRDGQPRVVDLEGEDADAVFGALSSTTAREIYARLDDEPGTPSDVADAIDSSIQNVRYHLEKLEDAGLVEVVDTWYSSRGNEMSVYATTDGPLIVTSDESTASQLKTAISRLIGGIGALAGGSLLVQYALTRQFGGVDAAPADGGAEPAGGDEEDGEPMSATEDDGDTVDESADSGDGSDGEDGGDDFSAEEVEDHSGGETEDAEEANGADAGDSGAADADDGGSADPEFDVDPNGSENATDPNGFFENIVDGGVEGVETVFGTMPPGLLFFLGGLVVLLAVTAYWYWYRPAY
ncbi:helix-turn-helix domain-containing protein [Halosolutus amylolyticus]|uniref:Helix-turn-helix domain-containing protein n=1 Tax=Halosolutus amylolyticus TaxID=2932267 RepID=A0ABD5PRU3_9EURY|nr:helix-turn-helix domain-containing protein [Halosolutus amylolyticus]